jgi:hypothetical protein
VDFRFRFPVLAFGQGNSGCAVPILMCRPQAGRRAGGLILTQFKLRIM